MQTLLKVLTRMVQFGLFSTATVATIGIVSFNKAGDSSASLMCLLTALICWVGLGLFTKAE